MDYSDTLEGEKIYLLSALGSFNGKFFIRI